MNIKRLLFSIIILSCQLRAMNASCAGAILVDTEGNGRPILWRNGVIHYNLERDSGATLGSFSNSDAIALVQELFTDWQHATLNGIETTSITFSEGASLGSVDNSNINQHFTYCPPENSCPNQSTLPFVVGSAETGESPIIFDNDGSITDMVEGTGASNSILGFAGPRVIENIGGQTYITEGQAVLNGKFIDGIRGPNNPETDIVSYKGVIIHELGHFMGVDHTQMNRSSIVKYLSDDLSEKAGIPTMYPLLVDGVEQFSLHYDDKVAISSLYPSASFTNSFCKLEGTVFRLDGTTQLQGVNLVLQSVSDPITEGTSAVSGSLYVGQSHNCDGNFGNYTVYGLIPGHEYTLSIEKISRTFTGGSSIEPCSTPQTGFQEKTLSGVFSCSVGGETITAGTGDSPMIVTTKQLVSTTSSQSGGCSLIP